MTKSNSINSVILLITCRFKTHLVTLFIVNLYLIDTQTSKKNHADILRIPYLRIV